MKLIRIISVFDVRTEELIKEVSIDHVPFASLIEIFNRDPNDPMLIKPICIKKNQLIEINKFLEEKMEYNDALYLYQLDCFQA